MDQRPQTSTVFAVATLTYGVLAYLLLALGALLVGNPVALVVLATGAGAIYWFQLRQWVEPDRFDLLDIVLWTFGVFAAGFTGSLILIGS